MITTRQLVFLVLGAAVMGLVWFAFDHGAKPRTEPALAKKKASRQIWRIIYCARLTPEGLYLGGTGILKIPFQDQRGGEINSNQVLFARPLLTTDYPPIMNFVNSPTTAKSDGRWWVASPMAEGRAASLVYRHDELSGSIPCMDFADVQFTADAKQIVSASYNWLAVFGTDRQEIISSKQFGGKEYFRGQDVILAPKGSGRRAYIQGKPGFWWDPVAQTRLTGLTREPQNRYKFSYEPEPKDDIEIGRYPDKLLFEVFERKTQRSIGKISAPKGITEIPQWYSFLGENGLAIPYENLVEIFSLKDAKLIARVYPFLGHAEEYAVVLADGTYMGTPESLKYLTVPVGKMDPPRVIRELLTKCGVKVAD